MSFVSSPHIARFVRSNHGFPLLIELDEDEVALNGPYRFYYIGEPNAFGTEYATAQGHLRMVSPLAQHICPNVYGRLRQAIEKAHKEYGGPEAVGENYIGRKSLSLAQTDQRMREKRKKAAQKSKAKPKPTKPKLEKRRTAPKTAIQRRELPKRTTPTATPRKRLHKRAHKR